MIAVLYHVACVLSGICLLVRMALALFPRPFAMLFPLFNLKSCFWYLPQVWFVGHEFFSCPCPFLFLSFSCNHGRQFCWVCMILDQLPSSFRTWNASLFWISQSTLEISCYSNGFPSPCDLCFFLLWLSIHFLCCANVVFFLCHAVGIFFSSLVYLVCCMPSSISMGCLFLVQGSFLR